MPEDIQPCLIEYDHSKNVHTLGGALACLSVIFASDKPNSLIDVGCGTGTWLEAALLLGINDVYGVDGVKSDTLHISNGLFQITDFRKEWGCSRKFDIALCLEVAEHIESEFVDIFFDSLCQTSNNIYFSAAVPGQPGQHHVNCHWPSYWQKHFNQRGFVCSDRIRWRIWDDPDIEVWYRQNMFTATYSPQEAGVESRIKPVVHPDFLSNFIGATIKPASTMFRRVISRFRSRIGS